MGLVRLVILGFALQLALVTCLCAEEKRLVAEAIGGVQQVEVVGSEHAFAPNVIIVKVNMPVEFKARKEATGVLLRPARVTVMSELKNGSQVPCSWLSAL